ncbi:MAG: Fic family protein [Xanthomonadales bacterium]|nr:Fic family protein [Xanthomonadales bacterium]
MRRDRYATDGSNESIYQPGSRGRVLANRAGIVRVRDMQQAESSALEALTLALLDEVEMAQCFTAADLCNWHRRWLGELYDWAGQYRQVNIGKGGFQFAAAHLLPRLMAGYERESLALFTPCMDMDDERLAQALAVTHAELVLVHPFRDGNGRLARLLNTLMALQAGLPTLDYGGIRGRNKRYYIGAIHASLNRNYAPMERVFRSVIARTRRYA